MPEFRIRLLAMGAICWIGFGIPQACAAQEKKEKADTVLYKVRPYGNPGGEQSAVDTTVSPASNEDSVGVGDTDSTSADTAAVLPPWYTLRKDAPPLILKPRHVPKGETQALLKDDDFWYVSVGPEKPQPVNVTAKEPKPLPAWVPFLIWTLLAGALVGAIVMFLQAASEEPWFRRSRTRRRNALHSEEEASAIPIDLDAALQKAVAAGDYREAVHVYYLKTVNALSARGLIFPAQDKLNREYLRELGGHPLQRDFARLLTHYEFAFYGGFALEMPAFKAIQEQYAQFQNRLDTL